ncbi:MAG: glycerol-3-phosphate 1-O-acyltransferase PlsY [Lachnospiraceae bacterium]|nr:glycerol-3-phosphate 1-O-acyltransferase PlsY [Lachnospiraceae bacterium]
MYYFGQIISLIIGYLFGMIETGRIFSRMTNADLEHKGSGNTGATNALRVAGKKAGAIVLFGDMLKTGVACIIAALLFKGFAPDVKIFCFFAGIGAILGHNFPFYLGFKGGKGVACTAMLALIIDWPVALICAAIFFSIAFGCGYVSISSLTAITILGLTFIVKSTCFGAYGLTEIANVELIILSLVMIGLTFYGHRTNIVRLMNGTENKFGSKKKNADAANDENEGN